MKSFVHRYQNTKWDYDVIHSTFAPRVHPHGLILTQNISSSRYQCNTNQLYQDVGRLDNCHCMPPLEDLSILIIFISSVISR